MRDGERYLPELEEVWSRFLKSPSFAVLASKNEWALDNDYSEEQCTKNPIIYFFRAALILSLAKEQQDEIQKHVEARQALNCANLAIQKSRDESNLGNFLSIFSLHFLASTDYPISSKVWEKYLMAVRKDQQSNLAKDFNFFAESQYLLGLLHQKKDRTPKSLVALITAALNGHEQARSKIAHRITFTQSPDGKLLSFSFVKDQVDISYQFLILQGLYANGEIDKKLYMEKLAELVPMAESQVKLDLLVDIQLERVFNADAATREALYNEVRSNKLISKDKEILFLNGVWQAAMSSPKYEFAAKEQREKIKSNNFFIQDYIEALKPIAMWTSFVTGCLTGYPIGILEHALLMPAVMKLDYYSWNQPTYPDNSGACPKGRAYLGKLGIDENRIPHAHLYIAETCLGGVASWAGRGLGIALSAVALAIASLIAFPIYCLVKNIRAYNEGLANFENNPNKAKLESDKMEAVMSKAAQASKEKAPCRTKIFSKPRKDDSISNDNNALNAGMAYAAPGGARQ